MTDAVGEKIALRMQIEGLMAEYTRVFNVGRYLDEIVRDEGRLRFRQRICVFDSELVPNSLVYPI